jgi:hypothetical protein
MSDISRRGFFGAATAAIGAAAVTATPEVSAQAPATPPPAAADETDRVS